MPAPTIKVNTSSTAPSIASVDQLEDTVNEALSRLYDEFSQGVTGLTPAGQWDASSGSFPSGSTARAFYFVSSGGSVDSETFETGDWLVPIIDDASTTVFDGNWTHGQYAGQSETVSLEQFGVVGAGSDDNLLLIAAMATGKPIRLDGSLYRFRSDAGSTNPAVFTSGSVAITASPHTEIRNVQTGGTKMEAIRCEGSEGTSTAVSQIGDGGVGLHKTITVASASGLAVGDWCILREAANVVAEPDPVFPSAPNQDISYWEYVRIDDITGSVVTCEAYLINKWNEPHSGGYGNSDIALNALTLTKVNLGPDVSIKGGRWTGGGSTGGGVKVKYCRRPDLSQMIFEGLSGSDNMGGSAFTFEYNIEPSALNLKSTRTLFAGILKRNMAGIYGHVLGNRTGNGTLGGAAGSGGGVIVSGELASKGYGINQFAPGKYNGDCFPMGDGTRYCSFEIKSNGAHCYTNPIRFGSDYNTVHLEAFSGVTGVLALAGEHNTVYVKSRGHPSNVVGVYGDNNTVYMLDCESYGTTLILNNGHIGNKVYGSAESFQANKITAQIGDVRETVVDLDIGDGVHNYAAGVTEHHSNDFNLRNNVGSSYRLERLFPNQRAWVHSRSLTLTQTAQTIKIPGNAEDANGLQDLVATSQNIGDGFKLSFQLNSGLALTYSEYDFLARDGDFYLKASSENAVDGDGGTYEGFIPKVQVSTDGTRLELYSEGVTNIPVHMRIEKY